MLFGSAAGHRGAEGGVDGDAGEAGSHIRSVVDVLIEPREGGGAAHEADGIDLDEQGDGHAVIRDFGIEDVDRSGGEGAREDGRGVLAEQIADLGRVWRGAGERDEHGRDLAFGKQPLGSNVAFHYAHAHG